MDDNKMTHGEGLDRSPTALAGRRIVIVLGGLVMGGAERQALLLARYLAGEQGAHVEVWGFGDPGWAAARCDEYGIPWRIVPLQWTGDPLRRFRGLARFARTLRGARPDVILSYTRLPNMACGLVWWWTGARLCVWHQTGPQIVGGLVEWLASRLTSRYVARAQHLEAFLIEMFGVKPGRVTVIRGGVESAIPESDRASWRSRLATNDAHFLACMVANLKTGKDHVTLVRAWRRVVDELESRGRPSTLLLAGRLGGAYERARTLVQELGLVAHVRFLGEVLDISGLLSAVDLGVLTSRSEGCPNAVLEYMAAGLAVAGADIPGIREVVGPDGYPFLAPAGDYESLAARILELEADSETRRRLGAANREHAETKFSPRLMWEKSAALILEGLRAAA